MKEEKYKVQFFQDSTYEIIETATWETVFQGTLCECEAWIRLKENENVDF